MHRKWEGFEGTAQKVFFDSPDSSYLAKFEETTVSHFGGTANSGLYHFLNSVDQEAYMDLPSSICVSQSHLFPSKGRTSFGSFRGWNMKGPPNFLNRLAGSHRLLAVHGATFQRFSREYAGVVNGVQKQR